jgi:hypothetical protein
MPAIFISQTADSILTQTPRYCNKKLVTLPFIFAGIIACITEITPLVIKQRTMSLGEHEAELRVFKISGAPLTN